MLGEILKVGDTVVVNIPDENWKWGCNPVGKQNGVKAKVVGFGEIHNTRIQSFGMEPGVYVNHSWVDIEAQGKREPIHISSCFVDLEDKEEEKRRLRKYRDAGGYLASKVRLRDLPETKLWEGDEVRWVGEQSCPWGERRIQVASINYDYFGQMCDDGVTPMPQYNISPIGGGGYVAVRETDLELVQRGNVWKHYHGEKIQFASLEEEVVFADMIGQVDEVKNPANDLYVWTLDEVLAAIRDGTADGIAVSNGLFGTSKSTRAKRFRDRDLGRRVATETLKGFKAVGS